MEKFDFSLKNPSELKHKNKNIFKTHLYLWATAAAADPWDWWAL